MRLHLMLLALLIIITTSFSGASQCSQKLSELPSAPELFGFRLGMTKDEIKARVPQTRFGKKDEFGVSKTTINPYFNESIDKSKFEGVRTISLDFLDEHLTSLWIGYDENYRVQAIDDFIKEISSSLKLMGKWSVSRGKGQQLKCSDFQVFVSTIAGGPSLRIVDSGAEETIAERRQAKEESDPTGEAQRAEESAPEIIGDKKAKVYYLPPCHSAAVLIPEANVIKFKSSEEAEKAGYKLAKGCH